MKHTLTVLAVIFFLGGCATTMPPNIEQIPVPVPFCPAPPEYMSKLPKEGGIDLLTDKSLPGNVAKEWHYEVEYLRGLVDIQAAIIEAYRKNNTDLEHLETDIKHLIEETNKKLRETQAPSQ
ncbi:hypothetical protein E4H12_10815 [Candidatus Thorarchaeota archaeon]|nr:MAG: hypothetical protein E4H12_10815 [Candidatus Thorarchaeota archaeon]